MFSNEFDRENLFAITSRLSEQAVFTRLHFLEKSEKFRLNQFKL